MTDTCPAPARHLATLTIATAIAVLLLIPGVERDLPDWSDHADKVYHVILFAVLALPTALSAPRDLRWVLPSALALGIALEFIQPSVGRTFSVGDMLADAAGLAHGTALGLLLRRRMRTTNPRQYP